MLEKRLFKKFVEAVIFYFLGLPLYFSDSSLLGDAVDPVDVLASDSPEGCPRAQSVA
jgi:hypothetical protein